jgi:hypothetical protein
VPVVLTLVGGTALIAFVFCLIVGRWWAFVPPLLLWPVYWLGFKTGWWEDSNDAEAIAAAFAVIGVVVAALGGYLGMATREQVRGRGA